MTEQSKTTPANDITKDIVGEYLVLIDKLPGGYEEAYCEDEKLDFLKKHNLNDGLEVDDLKWDIFRKFMNIKDDIDEKFSPTEQYSVFLDNIFNPEILEHTRSQIEKIKGRDPEKYYKPLSNEDAPDLVLKDMFNRAKFPQIENISHAQKSEMLVGKFNELFASGNNPELEKGMLREVDEKQDHTDLSRDGMYGSVKRSPGPNEIATAQTLIGYFANPSERQDEPGIKESLTDMWYKLRLNNEGVALYEELKARKYYEGLEPIKTTPRKNKESKSISP